MEEKREYRRGSFAKKINIHKSIRVNAKMAAMIGVWVTAKYDPDFPPMIHCYQKMGRDSFGANFTSADEMIEFYQAVLEWYVENRAVVQTALDDVWNKRHKYKNLEKEMKQEEIGKIVGTDNVKVGDFRS